MSELRADEPAGFFGHVVDHERRQRRRHPARRPTARAPPHTSSPRRAARPRHASPARARSGAGWSTRARASAGDTVAAPPCRDTRPGRCRATAPPRAKAGPPRRSADRTGRRASASSPRDGGMHGAPHGSGPSPTDAARVQTIARAGCEDRGAVGSSGEPPAREARFRSRIVPGPPPAPAADPQGQRASPT